MLSEAALAAAGLNSGPVKPGLPRLGLQRNGESGSFDQPFGAADAFSDCNADISSRGGGFSRDPSKEAPSLGGGPPVGLLKGLGLLREEDPGEAAGVTAPILEDNLLCGRCAACGSSVDGGWSRTRPLEGDDPGSPSNQQRASVLLEDQRMLSEISESMMGKLNNVLVFLQQTVSRERGKHSSDISMMMRKVDKDLKDTFLNVRETFAGLTAQLTQLVKEVENGRKQVRTIQAKYAAAKEAAEAQAQYVVELEAVLDSQGSGLSDVLKQLSEKYSSTQQSLSKTTEEGKKKVAALTAENKDLKLRLRRFEDEEKELKANKEPVSLPEMTASWTRHMTPSTRAPSAVSSPRAPMSARSRPGSRQWRSSFGQASTVVSSMMAHCDAKRSAPRTKHVQAQEPRACSPMTPTFKARDDELLLQMRTRAEVAEGRCKKQHRLMTFASRALLLLREIFLELRQSRCLTALDEPKASKSSSVLEASTVVERIAQLFAGAIPQLGNLSEVLSALSEEASKPPPEGRSSRESPFKES